MGRIVLCLSATLLLLSGCSKEAPLQPKPDAGASVKSTALATSSAPEYEPAYVNGNTVTINAIEVPNKAPLQAQADFYQVVYPIGWQALGLAPPQCNPCDHQHNGIDFTDYHDHVLDSAPSIPGGGEYRTLWHVFVVVPTYSRDANHDAAVSAAYATAGQVRGRGR